MKADAKVWIISAVLGAGGCAGGVVDEPQRKPLPQTSRPSDEPYGITPSRSGNAGMGGQPGRGGAAASSGGGGRTGGAGGADSASGASSAGFSGAGASAGAAGSASSVAGSAAISGAAGGNSEPTSECPSLTRVRLANGACVDRVTEFSVATNPSSIITGSDGRIWFDDGSANQIVQLDNLGGVLNRIACDPGSDQRELIPGKDDSILWFTDGREKTITRLSKGLQRTPYPIGFVPVGLSQEDSGQLWLTEAGKAVYRLNPLEPTPVRWAAAPNGTIIVGPDKNLWFPEGIQISRLIPDEGKQSFSITDSFADDICTGPDGALWFTDGSLHQIGRMGADGTLSRTFDLPPNSAPLRIISGPDGALWFTEQAAEKIGRISVKGVITHYPIPTKNSLPFALTVGPDHNIWFTERFSGKIGRLIPDSIQ
jgi:streptogramin lyase